MGRRIKSQDEKTILKRKEIDQLYVVAKERYLQEQGDPTRKGKSYQGVCDEVSNVHFSKTGHRISLSSSTLQRHVKGGKTKSKSNVEKGWLNEEENELIVSYAIELAERGFPMRLQELKRLAEEVLQARLGDTFPSTGLGKHWSRRFVRRNCDRLSKYMSQGLDKKRAKSVNSTTHRAWFKLLADTIQEHDIQADCIFGSDEVGFLLRPLTRCKVVGPVGQKIQYDCAFKNRENATVLCTICGDGSSLSPLVIFKGKYYFTSWGRNNVDGFMIGRSVTGWITGDIGIEWMRHFDKLTRDKAKGRQRLLLVDGHCSHYTVAFLQHARKNGIQILCYPSHTTHVYQGLDVAIFSPLKLHYHEELRTYERNGGGRVTKEVFMLIYSAAHKKAFVPDIIKIAWAKTGVIPLNPNAIKASVLKPSLETSSQPSNVPLGQVHSTPTRLVISLLEQARQIKSANAISLSSSTYIGNTVDKLRQSEVGFLLPSDNMSSRARSRIPLPNLARMPRLPKTKLELIKHMPTNSENELLLKNTMEIMADKLEEQAKRINALEATMVLRETYVNKLQVQLNSKEKKHVSRVWLLGDGLPVLLTGEDFYARVKERQEKREEDDKRKVLASQARRIRLEEMKAWKKDDDERKERNRAMRITYRTRLCEWEIRKGAAKAARMRFSETRPICGKPEKMKAKPSKSQAVVQELDDDEECIDLDLDADRSDGDENENEEEEDDNDDD